jgi:hypothetical protein
MIEPKLEQLKARIVETGELDRGHRLRPLLLFFGSQSEGRVRSLFNLVLAMMDAEVDTVSQAVKIATAEDMRHLCGLHVNPVQHSFTSILSRIYARKDVADLVPGLWQYVRYLGRQGNGNSPNGHLFSLYQISEHAARVRSSRIWRLTPEHLRPHKVAKPKLPEFYPYITEAPTDEHALLLAVDAIVPKGLPNSVRCDVCQDMIVAVLSGRATVGNLKDGVGKYLREFWKMFPDRYGHISLDAAVPGTTDMAWSDKLNARTSRLA